MINFNHKNELSSDAKDMLTWITEETIVDPDNWHFTLSSGGKRFSATPQLKRDLVRKTLVEINEYKPEFLPDQIKKDFNLTRIAQQDDLIPTETEISRLKEKFHKLIEDAQVGFWIKCLNEDAQYKIGNTIVSAWMIDIKDIISFLNGESIENLYYTISERRRKFDSP